MKNQHQLDRPRTGRRTARLTFAAGAVVLAAAAVTSLGQSTPASITQIRDGSFEDQAVLQSNPFLLQPSGAKWGAGWNNWGWSSWQDNSASAGAWVGGAIARTEEHSAGWKWARTGDVFGIIKNNQTMSQSFTATASGIGTLLWYDANRAAWRNLDWFGRPNNYSVTLTDELGNVQLLGNFTSVVAGGNSYSNPPGNGWWTTEGKSTWFARSATGFTLVAGRKYTLRFNSLSPNNDDRSTFLDDISLTIGPPSFVKPKIKAWQAASPTP